MEDMDFMKRRWMPVKKTNIRDHEGMMDAMKQLYGSDDQKPCSEPPIAPESIFEPKDGKDELQD